MEISIYKEITTEKIFLEYLIEKKLKQVGKSKVYSSKIFIDDKELIKKMQIKFFSKVESEQSQIEWLNYWGTFFGGSASNSKTIESAYGIIFIKIQREIYVISLGRGHHYASSSADFDFGFDIAEIIHDDASIDVKSSKFFKQSKNKSLTQYNSNSFVMTEIGESHELLISKIIMNKKFSKFLLYKYENKMKFGVSVKLEINNYNPPEIFDIVHELQWILKNEKKSGQLPRMNILKNNIDNKPMIADLNKELLESLKSLKSSVSLSYFVEENGDMLSEIVMDDTVQLVYNKAYDIPVYNMENISKLLVEINCEDINSVKIRPKSDKNKHIKLVRLLDFSTVYRGKNYCLYKGKWANFNKSYLEFIQQEILNVNEIALYNEEFNLTDDVLLKGRKIQKADIEKYDQVSYAEYPFNIFLEKNYNYKLLDRVKGQEYYKSVEFADLYDDTSQALIHVKIGATPDLRVCIQQSTHSAEILNTQENALKFHNITKVNKISMLLILDSFRVILEDGTIDFSKNSSIYFKIEVIEWLIKIRTLGYVPEIIIAKDLRKKIPKKKIKNS
ncbi:uncharacterized protein (TIGR04141 family) [Paenibacillus sp. SORGH_AS306]|uniref:DUF6119 family protein n=1 Tax=unclassified Paenibacillus TaxID=185978 RepID=UPI002789B89A|nr:MULTISPECIES: DUF6119 family protein [unclassified Paenibacillus]MDQ1234829.1 uncharacterized protein (TIGR04141 family) [Paenibacillus sp. SORGH_AS_0306]MDR6111876.1 uncharacterized protein (TIGR04141 family) [Paenibacillus sp. SORGH_AS_0338]